jgi:hypothetical protein
MTLKLILTVLICILVAFFAAIAFQVEIWEGAVIAALTTIASVAGHYIVDWLVKKK